MSRALFNPNAEDGFDLFLSSIDRPEDLYLIDGETAFRRTPHGSIETFDPLDREHFYTGGDL